MSVTITGSAAIISADKQHRYLLSRSWDSKKPTITFICLNPSRADAIRNDATITRCINFSADWGYGSMHFVNLYSIRTPYVTRKQLDVAPKIEGENFNPLLEILPVAIGSECNEWLIYAIKRSLTVVCAWGSWDFTTVRAKEVYDMILQHGRGPVCMGTNKAGTPKHPLYLPKTTKLIPFTL